MNGGVCEITLPTRWQDDLRSAPPGYWPRQAPQPPLSALEQNSRWRHAGPGVSSGSRSYGRVIDESG